MPSQDGAKRAIGQNEIEAKALTQLLDAIGLANMSGADTGLYALTNIGGMTARLVNRGKPAGYVVTSEGTFMVTVEIVSRAVMASE